MISELKSPYSVPRVFDSFGIGTITAGLVYILVITSVLEDTGLSTIDLVVVWAGQLKDINVPSELTLIFAAIVTFSLYAIGLLTFAYGDPFANIVMNVQEDQERRVAEVIKRSDNSLWNHYTENQAQNTSFLGIVGSGAIVLLCYSVTVSGYILGGTTEFPSVYIMIFSGSLTFLGLARISINGRSFDNILNNLDEPNIP